MTEFTGKNVIITGAAGGIGQEMCRHFGRLGAKIGAIDQHETVHEFAAGLSAEGFTVESAVADIASRDQVAAAFDAIGKSLGPCEILINNAGISNASNLETTDDEIWCRDIDINLNGAYHCTRLALEDMKPAGQGVIVIIGSVNGMSTYGDPAYSAAKAGLISFTKSTALEYGRFAIRCNLVAPGTVRTPIWEHRVKRNPEIFENLVKWYPLRRVAVPEDVVKATAFLASDAAAAITGAVLPVDCGLSAGNIVMTREITMLEF